MPIINGYCTLAELKSEQDIPDTADDATLEQAIEAASRSIDDHTGRFFYKNSSDETRYYTAECGDLLFVDDLVSITTLATDDTGSRTYVTVWASTDYDLEPANAALHSRPYLRILPQPTSVRYFPVQRRGIKIVGVFGWPAVPPQAKRACLIQAARFWKRKDAIFGVMGSAELGVVQVLPTLDPDVRLLLTPLLRPAAIGI